MTCVWSPVPAAERWEVYTVLADSETFLTRSRWNRRPVRPAALGDRDLRAARRTPRHRARLFTPDHKLPVWIGGGLGPLLAIGSPGLQRNAISAGPGRRGAAAHRHRIACMMMYLRWLRCGSYDRSSTPSPCDRKLLLAALFWCGGWSALMFTSPGCSLRPCRSTAPHHHRRLHRASRW